MKHGKAFQPKSGMPNSAPGVVEACGRNPNKHAKLNSAPDGPYAHLLGYTDDGGVHGDTTAGGKHGETFHFK
jgi:hypothetical protein